MNKLTPAELAAFLETGIAPTDAQSTVIALDHAGVHLVLAGAGSGKTETMAARAVWLVVTEDIAPDHVLGLTFTRKAAQELSERFRRRIAQARAKRAELRERGYALSNLGEDDHGFAVPTVATYNAFASSIFTEHAARIGWDSDAPVITTATAYGIARAVVDASTDDRLAAFEMSPTVIAEAVISLAAELSEFDQIDNDDVIDYAEMFATLAARDERKTSGYRDKFAHVGRLVALVPLAREYIAEKRRRGVVEFSDQVVFARRIIAENPDIRDAYRARFDAVILDEYQDTAYSQTSLFTELFGAKRVTAVGDPNQSIYGWRGASPTNVAGFFEAFTVDPDSPTHELTESRRNGHRILEAANTILNNREQELRRDVSRLTAHPEASDFPIAATFAASLDVEAHRIAEWFLEQRATQVWDPQKQKLRDQTLAMLIRSRTNLPTILAAFDAAGLPYRVLGVAGILSNPFIADLYCTLSVIADPSAGSELVRLLGGARWRVSVDDLWALHNHARNVAGSYLTNEQRQHFGASLVADETDSLVDALDTLRDTERGAIETEGERGRQRVQFSDEGYAQLRAAAEFFHRLRTEANLPIPQVVRSVADALLLDVEGFALTEERRKSDAEREAFNDLLLSYLAIPAEHSLRSFLAWLSEVEKRDRETPREDEPEPGTVQILTIHSSKGLEWDAVALPRWTAERANDETRNANQYGWLRFGSLPARFRVGQETVGHLSISPDMSEQELDAEVKEYGERLKQEVYLPEERRIVYVALTRARHHLMISGSHFEGHNANAKKPNRYWNELVAAGLIDPTVVDEVPETNPRGDKDMVVWPAIDPLGSAENRARFERAAAEVAAARASVTDEERALIDLLIAQDGGEAPPLPVRIPASRYAEWSVDLSATRERTRRPLPSRPYRAARIGTEVHTWIEQGRFDDDGQLPLPWDQEGESITPGRVEELTTRFAASHWAKRDAEYQELEILLPQGDHVIVCTIDAVYRIDGRWTVVDWKTGATPKTEADKDAKAMQLVLYRRAFASWKGIDPQDVDAVLYYIAHDEEWKIEPERLARLDALPTIGI